MMVPREIKAPNPRQRRGALRQRQGLVQQRGVGQELRPGEPGEQRAAGEQLIEQEPRGPEHLALPRVVLDRADLGEREPAKLLVRDPSGQALGTLPTQLGRGAPEEELVGGAVARLGPHAAGGVALRVEVDQTALSLAMGDVMRRVREALGKQGWISALLKTLGGMSPEERQVQGPAIQALRQQAADAIAARKGELEAAELEARLATETVWRGSLSGLHLDVVTPESAAPPLSPIASSR